jgi:two-component system nitrogen regulation sensor histidine kinase NtrY
MATKEFTGNDAASQEGIFSIGGKPMFYTGLVLVTLSLVFGLLTYLILTGLTPIRPRHSVVVTVLLINIVLILGMVMVIAWHIMELLRNYRQGRAGARLHVRFVRQFAFVASLPAIILAVFASISLNRGLDHLFSAHTKVLVRDSLEVAKAYMNEHSEVMRADMVAVASAVEKELPKLVERPREIITLLQFHSALRALPNLYLINSEGTLLASGGSSPEPYRKPPAGPLGAAQDGTVILIPPSNNNKIAAIKKLEKPADRYIYASRDINPVVIRHVQRARANVSEYIKLEKGRTGVQIAFAAMYVAIALTLLLAAIWLGLLFANRFSEPVKRLIAAAQSVSEGNLDTVVHLKPRHGELAQLGSTFNNMTAEIKSQQNQLLDTNLMLDERRRFIEAVLSGVSAGVIGLDNFGIVDHVNRSAEKLLGRQRRELIGKRLEQVAPEFRKAIMQARAQEGDGDEKPIQCDVKMKVEDGERHFVVRMTRESSDDREYGFVLTFDDTTELIKAQRSSAWADVAQRIAHEMKNPLLPIQLAADRIRRNYGPMLEKKDRGILDESVDTIIARVADIKRMVDEFSDFARMPEPIMELYDIRDIVSGITSLYQQSEQDIELSVSLPKKPIISLCDKGLISQAMINIIKNATEAIICAYEKKPLLKSYSGKIWVKLKHQGKEFTIEVTDNGCGLPSEQRNRLLEPYVTTRDKGTGLGLAIVQKIIEQHGGRIYLEDAPKTGKRSSGARISLILPYRKKDKPKGKNGKPSGSNGVGGAAKTGYEEQNDGERRHV